MLQIRSTHSPEYKVKNASLKNRLKLFNIHSDILPSEDDYQHPIQEDNRGFFLHGMILALWTLTKRINDQKWSMLLLPLLIINFKLWYFLKFEVEDKVRKFLFFCSCWLIFHGLEHNAADTYVEYRNEVLVLIVPCRLAASYSE